MRSRTCVEMQQREIQCFITGEKHVSFPLADPGLQLDIYYISINAGSKGKPTPPKYKCAEIPREASPREEVHSPRSCGSWALKACRNSALLIQGLFTQNTLTPHPALLLAALLDNLRWLRREAFPQWNTSFGTSWIYKPNLASGQPGLYSNEWLKPLSLFLQITIYPQCIGIKHAKCFVLLSNWL